MNFALMFGSESLMWDNQIFHIKRRYGITIIFDKLAKSLWLSFLRMQESIEYSIITELVFRRMSGKSKFSDFLRFCH
jgi:hypothetical protein